MRHNPYPLMMDKNGWIEVEHLLNYLQINKELLDNIVDTNNKKRFSFSEDETKIRANQGHSLNVDVELKEREPPNTLYHGSAKKFSHLIYKQGIKKMDRQYVHLSADIETAKQVGKRHGEYIIYWIKTSRMYDDGKKFYLSENGVWLTDYIELKYIFKM